jgi:acyl-CoA thioester hydrolase
LSTPFEPPPGRAVFAADFTPAPADIDANGHVNNVVYVGWMQDIAIAHWDSKVSAADAATWAWIVLRHEVDYRRPLKLGETAYARTWVADAPEGPRFDRIVRIDGPDGAMCAQARTTWCLIEQATGRPRRVPAAMAATFL